MTSFITALVLVLTFPFTSAAWIKTTTDEAIFSTLEAVPAKEAALILGAAAYPSRLSDVLKDRVETGIDLYKAGKVKMLIMSGSAHEAKSMAEYALKAGVPESALIEDEKGLNTFNSLDNAKDQTSLVVVSQAYHLPRALFYARHFNLDAVGMSADRQEYQWMWLYTKREKIAHMKAVFDVYVFPLLGLSQEEVMKLNEALQNLG